MAIGRLRCTAPALHVPAADSAAAGTGNTRHARRIVMQHATYHTARSHAARHVACITQHDSCRPTLRQPRCGGGSLAFRLPVLKCATALRAAVAAGELHRVRALAWGVRRQMLADIMFRKSENDAAIYHFEQFLQQKPRHVRVHVPARGSSPACACSRACVLASSCVSSSVCAVTTSRLHGSRRCCGARAGWTRRRGTSRCTGAAPLQSTRCAVR